MGDKTHNSTWTTIANQSFLGYTESSGFSSSSTSPWIRNEQNSTSINKAQETQYPIMWYRFLLVIVIFITAVGNVLVCLAIAREKKLQNTTNYFLMSLAIADCLVAVLVMPMGMISEVLGHFPLPDSACIIFATLDVLCCTSSIWHMSTMSMDRYFTIRFPFRYGRNKTRRIMLWKIITVWVISAGVSSPIFVLGIIDEKNVLDNGTCAPNNESFKMYGSIFAFYIPCIIMIVTYTLTMRSLRNVLVNKKRYNRERRRKQTFRPLAQIIHQYAELAHGIRHSPSNEKRFTNPLTRNNINSNNNTNNSNSTLASLITGKPSGYTYIPTSITTATSNEHRSHFLSSNANFQDETSTQNHSNTMSMPNDSFHNHSQHLTINYMKPTIGRKRRYQQQQNTSTNINVNRKTNDSDMSTVYEITEYSKSTSSSYDVTMSLSTDGHRRSSNFNDQHSYHNSTQKNSMLTSSTNESTTTTAIVNDRSMLTDDELSSSSDIEINADSSTKNQREVSTIDFPCTTRELEPIGNNALIISWNNYLLLIQSFCRFYLSQYFSRFPFQMSERQENSVQCHRSTSTSSIAEKNHKSVSVQTNLLPKIEESRRSSTNHPQFYVYDSSKRRKLPSSSTLFTSSSILSRCFRPSPNNLLRSSQSSTKSSLSWGQRSSTLSSSTAVRTTLPSIATSLEAFRRAESDTENLQGADRRSHMSTSSSSLLHTNYYQRNSSSACPQKSFRRNQNHSTLSYLTGKKYQRRKHNQRLSSTTNTNSSDSSIYIQRCHPVVLKTVTNHQHSHNESLVAANERKALKVLMIIFCVFITLWTPFFICTLLSAVFKSFQAKITHDIWFSITWLGYCSSMANPFIYTIFSDLFRRAFLNILLCRWNEQSYPGHCSSRISNAKGNHTPQQLQRQISTRRTYHLEHSRPSTPVLINQTIPISTTDGTPYVKQRLSDSSR